MRRIPFFKNGPHWKLFDFAGRAFDLRSLELGSSEVGISDRIGNLFLKEAHFLRSAARGDELGFGVAP